MATRPRSRVRVGSTAVATAAVILGLAACSSDAELSSSTTTKIIRPVTTTPTGQGAAGAYLRSIPGVTFAEAANSAAFNQAVGSLRLATDGFVRKDAQRDGATVATVNVVELKAPDPGAATTLAAAFGYSAGSTGQARTIAGVPVTAFAAPSGTGLGLVWVANDRTVVLVNGADATATTALAESLITANATK